jgi:hypothetical protein
MSLLSAFISTQLMKAIENEFVNHSPEIQSIIISEIQNLIAEGTAWIDSKLNSNETKIGD